MSPKLRAILIVIAKQAINSLLVNILPLIFYNGTFNVTSLAGLKHMGLLALSAVLSREVMYWAPKLLAWSQT
jgi:hypothetical protein